MYNLNIKTWIIFSLATGSLAAVFLYVLVIYGKMLLRQRTTRTGPEILDTNQPLGREGVSISATISTGYVSLFLLIFVVCYTPLLVLSFMIVFGQDGASMLVMETIEALFTPMQGDLSILST